MCWFKLIKIKEEINLKYRSTCGTNIHWFEFFENAERREEFLKT